MKKGAAKGKKARASADRAAKNRKKSNNGSKTKRKKEQEANVDDPGRDDQFESYDILDEEDSSDDGDHSRNPNFVDLDDDDMDFSPKDGEDEEIDSDDAMFDDDEDLDGLFPQSLLDRMKAEKEKRKGAAGKLSRADDAILQESDDDDDDDDNSDDGEEYITLSEMLATRDEDKEGTPKDSGSDGEDEGQNNNLLDSDDEDDEDDEASEGKSAAERHVSMLKGIARMSKQSHKRAERVEAEEPSINALRSTRQNQLQLEDLLGSLGDGGAALGSLKKQMASFKKREKKTKLAKPIDSGLQREYDRAAAYKKVTKDMTNWLPVVQSHRQKEHMSYPLGASKLLSTNASITTQFKARYAMETQIESTLKQGKVVEQKNKELTVAEEDALRNVDPLELKSRQQELAKMKALNSYYEAKCRRINKIKSKTYRKIRKKARQHLSADDLEDVDPVEAARLREKQERKRAEERMSLKHKNQGKWAKHMLGRRAMDRETRQAIGEQMRIGDELRRKATMADDDDSDDDSDRGNDSDFDEDREEVGDAIARLEEDLNPAHMPEIATKSGIEGMKFMQLAAEKKRQEAQQALQDLKDEIAGNQKHDGGSRQGESSGRMAFGPKDKVVGGSQHKQQPPSQSKTGSDVASFRGGTKVVRVNANITIPLARGKRGAQSKAAASIRPEAFDEDEWEAELNDDDLIVENDVVLGKNWGSDQEGASDAQSESQPANANAEGGDGGKTKKKKTPKKPGKQQQQQAGDPAVSDKRRVEKGGNKGSRMAKAGGTQPDTEEKKSSAANPWLQAIQSDVGKTPEMLLNANSSKAEVRTAKLQQRRKGSAATINSTTLDELEASIVDEAALTASTDNANKRRSSGSGSNGKAKHGKRRTNEKQGAEGAGSRDIGDSDSDSDSDSDNEETSGIKLNLRKGGKAQRDLIAAAFAGDDVFEEDFAREKAREIEASTPKDKDLTLPGWGVWAGGNIANPFPSRRIVKKAGPAKARKDQKLKNVVISEKIDKKLNKKLVQKVPYPFKTMAQYEQSMRLPVGREWNTDKGFRNRVLPNVETKAGTIIEPIRKTKSIAEGKALAGSKYANPTKRNKRS